MAMARAEARSAKELLQTIASRSSDPDFFGSLSYLPNPDRVLAKLGARDTVYDDIATDAHAFAVIQQRKSATLRLAWDVTAASSEAADRKAADLGRAVLQALDLEHLVATLLDAPLRGRAYAEAIWESDGAQIVPTAVVDRPQRRFVYAPPDGDLRLLTLSNQVDGEPIPERKILQARQWPTYDNPYGWAALSRCFWPWTFKHNATKFWVILSEKFGLPFIWGEIARGSGDVEMRTLLNALTQLRQDGVGVGPSDGAVKILESNAASKGELHAALTAVCNAEISKAIIGQTLTSEVGDKGSYAASKTHGEVRQDIAEGDQRLVAGAIGDLLRWTTELNVAGATPPTFIFLQEEDRAEWLKLFEGAVKIGLPVARAFVHEKLQIPEPEEGDAVLTPATSAPKPGAGFDDPSGDVDIVAGRRPVAFAADDPVGDGMLQLEAAAIEKATPALRSVSEHLARLRDGVATLEQLRGELARALPSLPLESVADLVARTLFVADLNGQASVLDEVDSGPSFAFASVFEPLPFDEAIEAFRRRIPVSPEVMGRLALNARARAFSVAGVACMDALEEMRAAVDRAIADGTTMADFRKRMAEIADAREMLPLGRAHVETIFRTNISTALSAGRYRQQTAPAVLQARPFWQYLTADDGDVRPTHAALHGKVFAADDPVWQQIYPPNGFRCRCRVVTLSARQVAARGVQVETGDQVLNKPIQVGATTVTPRPDMGWNHNPAAETWDPDLSKYPEEMRAEFERRQGEWAAKTPKVE